MTKTNRKLPTVFDSTTTPDNSIPKSVANYLHDHSQQLSTLFIKIRELEAKVANSGCKCDKSDRVELKVQNDSTPNDIATLIEKVVNYGENTETKVVTRDPIHAPGCRSDGIPTFRFEEKDDSDKKSSIKYEGADVASYAELYDRAHSASNGTAIVKVQGYHPLINPFGYGGCTFQLRELMNCGDSVITLDAVGCIESICANMTRCVREVLKTDLSKKMLNVSKDTIRIISDIRLSLDAINGNLIAARVFVHVYTVSEDDGSTLIPIGNNLDFVFGMEGQKMVAYREFITPTGQSTIQKISNF